MSKYLTTREALIEVLANYLRGAHYEEHIPGEYDPENWHAADMCMKVELCGDHDNVALKNEVVALLHKPRFGDAVVVTLEYESSPHEYYNCDRLSLSSNVSMSQCFHLETPTVFDEDGHCYPSTYAFASPEDMMGVMLKAFYTRCVAIDILDKRNPYIPAL